MTVVVDRNQYDWHIYFKIKDRIYMEYNLNNGDLRFSYCEIWSILLSEYRCSDMEINELIKDKTIEHFKVSTEIQVGSGLSPRRWR